MSLESRPRGHVPTTGMHIAGPQGPDTLELGEFRGAGAFGFVYEARSLVSGARYAVKFPQAGVFGVERELQAFLNEVTAAKTIVHPNVVRVLHVEEAPVGVPPYLVMEFIEGGTLRAALDKVEEAKGSVEPDRVRVWSRSLSEALRAINAEMLHRDIKPDNILIAGETLKVSDFGLAKLVGAATRTNTFKGGQHLLYMAPEGWAGGKNTPRTDMYSLGIVFHEIAALKYPYKLPKDATDYEAMRNMHMYGEPSSLLSARPDLPPGFSIVVARMMEKRADARYGSWDHVIEALDTVWAGGRLDTGKSPIVQTILTELARQNEQDTVNRLAREAAEGKACDEHRLDLHQARKLVERLDAVFAELKSRDLSSRPESDKHTPEVARRAAIIMQKLRPQDGVEPDLARTYELGKAVVSLSFFRVQPDMEVRSIGKVRFAGRMMDKAGNGYNYLLARSGEEDIYGSWFIGVVETNPLLRDRSRVWAPQVRWFGFPAEHIQHLGLATQSAHVYQVQVSEANDERFLQFLHESVRLAGAAD